jgi:hypothetical protein
MKGQGATEYLVLLAVVLVIALVSIALLGFFPGISTDAKITQSQTYWKSARPFAIQEASITTGGVAVLILQNMEASGSLTVTGIELAKTSGNGTGSQSTQITLAPGDTANYTISNMTGAMTGTPTAGSTYDLRVTINYLTSNGVNMTQFGGSKTLVGKYR